MNSDSQPPISLFSLFAAHQHLLRERLHLLLATLHSDLHADVVRTLEDSGKLLFQPDEESNSFPFASSFSTWPLLTLLVAQYTSADIDLECASRVAVAVECFVCALDLLDDVEDEDQTPIFQAIGTSRVLNVSTALLMLAHQALLSLAHYGVAPALILRLLETLQAAALIATAGQHRDLLAEQRSAQDLTNQECIEIATAKAGAIMRLAFRLGAMCAGADDKLCDQLSEMGEMLGIAHQLDNDCHDLYHLLKGETSTILPGEAGNATTQNIKSDLVRGKKTLPIVLAAHISTPHQITPESTDEEKKEYLQALHEGIVTTWGISLLYRERARNCLQEIEVQKPFAPALRFLLGL